MKMHEEISCITSQFLKVGYPRWLIQDKVNKTLAKILYKKNPDQYPNPDAHREGLEELPTKWSVLYLPWSGVPASAIVNKMRKSLPREHSRISIAYRTQKVRDLLPHYHTCKSTDKVLSSSNVVYKYTCDCGQVYIGETKRRLAIRVVEHTKPKSNVLEHVKICPSAQFSNSKFSIVARGLRGRESRKRYETLWIRYYDRRSLAFNVDKSSRDLKIF